MAAIGHPIVGDSRHGNEASMKVSRSAGIGLQLAAVQVRIPHGTAQGSQKAKKTLDKCVAGDDPVSDSPLVEVLQSQVSNHILEVEIGMPPEMHSFLSNLAARANS